MAIMRRPAAYASTGAAPWALNVALAVSCAALAMINAQRHPIGAAFAGALAVTHVVLAVLRRRRHRASAVRSNAAPSSPSSAAAPSAPPSAHHPKTNP